jgi:hypothetical protein
MSDLFETGLFEPDEYIEQWGLADRFGIPPFSVLDTKSGRWQERRGLWDSLHLDDDGLGRADDLTFNKSGGTDPVSQMIATTGDSRTSLFDPVLTELVLRWWSPASGVVLDPFAGGPVRGIVSALLGRTYHGVDLSPDQVGTNQRTANRVLAPHNPVPLWHIGDASTYQPDVTADLILSCPPYGTLERYSDDPRDLSTMKADRFIGPYRTAIDKAVSRLADDRFAVFVVGNYRESGRMVDLVGMTVEAFGRAGADYYGDLVLLNPVGTARLRASATFNAGRKPTMIHQHVVVCVKGDGMKAAANAQRIDPLE